MATEQLSTYIDLLHKEQELAVIDTPVDPHLELMEIQRRVMEAGGPALLFTQVKGSTFPVAANLFGTHRRVKLALGPKPEQWIQHAVDVYPYLMEPKLLNLWKGKEALLGLLRLGTKMVTPSAASVLQVCDRRDKLLKLPRVTSTGEPTGSNSLLPLLLYNRPGASGQQLRLDPCGLTVLNKDAAKLHLGNQTQRLIGEAAQPAAVLLGGPPAILAAAMAPLPRQLPRLLFASMLQGSKLKLANNPLEDDIAPLVLAHTEIALCGVLNSPGSKTSLGSFTTQHIWHRRNAIYPVASHANRLHVELNLLNEVQQLMAPLLSLFLPGIRAYWTYGEAGSNKVASAVVRKGSHREVLDAVFTLLGEEELAPSQLLLVTDGEVPPDSVPFDKLLETVLERFDPAKDLFIFDHNPQTSKIGSWAGYPEEAKGSRAVMLGLGPRMRELPSEYKGGFLQGIRKVKPYCRGCLVVAGPSVEEEPDLARRLVETAADKLESWPLVIVADDTRCTSHQAAFLKTVFAGLDLAEQLVSRVSIQRNHLVHSLPLVLDVRRKPMESAAVPQSDLEAAAQVNRRWRDYFPN